MLRISSYNSKLIYDFRNLILGVSESSKSPSQYGGFKETNFSWWTLEIPAMNQNCASSETTATQQLDIILRDNQLAFFV